jgi:hypothetical protein
VQDGHPACCRQTVTGQIAEGIDIAKFRPLSGGFGHFLIPMWSIKVNLTATCADSIATQQTDMRISVTNGKTIYF